MSPVCDFFFDVSSEGQFVDLGNVTDLVEHCALNLLELLNDIEQTGPGLLEVLLLGVEWPSHGSSEHDVSVAVTQLIRLLCTLLFHYYLKF